MKPKQKSHDDSSTNSTATNLEKRKKLKKELYKDATGLFDKFDSYKLVFEDKARNYTARQIEDDEGNTITLAEMFIPDFTEENWKYWHDDPTGVNDRMTPRLTVTLVDSEDGFNTYNYQLRMPLFLATRYTVTTFYFYEDKETGWRTFIDSSKGNKDIEKRLKEDGTLEKSFVEAFMFFNMAQARPYEGGMQLRMSAKLDIGGTIPNIVKKLIYKKMTNLLM